MKQVLLSLFLRLACSIISSVLKKHAPQVSYGLSVETKFPARNTSVEALNNGVAHCSLHPINQEKHLSISNEGPAPILTEQYRGPYRRFSHRNPPTPVLHPSSTNTQQQRKRSLAQATLTPPPPPPLPLTMVDSSALNGAQVGSTPLMLSGVKEYLGALAMLEDNVKKLKSSGGKGSSPGQVISKGQMESTLNSLEEWLYESCGRVSFSCVEHPKFKSFLTQVGLPPISIKYIVGTKLDAKYEEVRNESDAKLRDAMFFQLESDGWKKKGVACTVKLARPSSVPDTPATSKAEVATRAATVVEAVDSVG